MFIAFDVALTVGILDYKKELHNQGRTKAVKLLLVANSIQMKVMNAIWDKLAYVLTDFENHETETDYTEAAVTRIFVFQFVNSFASLFYIAYFKRFAEGCEGYAHCTDELTESLRILFLGDVVICIVGSFWPYIQFRCQHSHHQKELVQQEGEGAYVQLGAKERKSFVEIQKELPENDIKNQIEEDMEVTIGLGFVLFFGMVAPEVFLFFFLASLIRLRTWGFKWLFALRRPMPQGAPGLGHMNQIYRLMMRFAVASNIALMVVKSAESGHDIFLPMKLLLTNPEEDIGNDWKSMLVVALLLDRFVVILQHQIDQLVPDIPEEVWVHRKRREHAVSLYQNLLVHTAEGGEVQKVCLSLPDFRKHVQVLKVTAERGLWQAAADLPSLVASGTRRDDSQDGQPLIRSWRPGDESFDDAHMTWAPMRFRSFLRATDEEGTESAAFVKDLDV